MAVQETLIESFRLSPQQRHLCAMQGIEEPFPFRAYCVARIEGPLDISRFRAALEQLVERHEILRTSFPCLPGLKLPVQVINAEMPLPLTIHDCRSVAVQEQEKALGQLREAMLQRSSPLKDERQWSVLLAICEDERHVLLWDVSALCADTKTCQVLLHELSQLYSQESHGEAIETLQYADLAEWQYELLESEEMEQGKAYWHSLEEHDVLKDISLPYERRSDRLSPFIRRSVSINVAIDEYEQLQSAAQRLAVSPSTVLLTCWGMLLSCLSGQGFLPISSAFSGRTYEELGEAVGLLTKFLPLPYQFQEEARFSEVACRVEATQQEASKWQTYFDWPLFEARKEQEQEPCAAFGFSYETLPVPWQAGSLRWVVEEQEACLERCKVSLSILEFAWGLQVTLHYDAEKFAQEDMQRLLAQWQLVLQQVLASSEVKLASLQLLTYGEQQQILYDWNATRADYPREMCLHRLFEMQVERTPNNIAIVHADEQVSYRELDRRANQLAHYLRRHGVGPEVCVGICLERSIYLLVGLLGILKAGGAYVPCDPTYPQERLTFVLRDANIPLLLTQVHLLERFTDATSEIVCLDSLGTALSAELDAPLEGEESVEQLAYVLYTSGSTGQPKGVMVPQRGLVNYLYWAQQTYAVPGQDSAYGAPLHSPIGFDLTVTSLFVPLLAGRSVLLLSEEEGVAALGSALSGKNRFTLTKVTPAHLQVLSQLLTAEQLAENAQVLVMGGEALGYESLALWRQCAPGTRLINEYGPTETVVGCCVYEVPAQTAASGFVPIGRPIANMQMYVLNKHLQPVPVGVSAELYVGGVGVTRGYLNRPEQTAERFIPHPFSSEPGARLYRTGDLARYLPSGELEYMGRVDQQLKIRGFRIEPGEIEMCLQKHPAVQECVVLAREDGAGNKHLVAYIVLRQRQTIRSINLRAYLQDHLPSYMIPANFVPLAALPLTSNGKVDRRKLLEIEDGERIERAEDFVAPRSSVEETLATVWSQVLHVEQIGIHDNFFALGGDSIVSIQVVTRAKQAGLHMVPRQLFQYQTIAQLASIVTDPVQSSAEQALVSGSVPLTPIQHCFFARNIPQKHHYNQAVILAIRQTLRPAWVQQALSHLVHHHDALRLRFIPQDDGWQQEIAEVLPHSPFLCVDLSGLPDDQQSSVQAALAEEAQSSIELGAGLLLRALFFTHGSGSDDHLLLIIHHLAVDGVSWRILLEDLETLCQQLCQRDQLQLTDKTTSWRQWAQFLEKYAQTEELRAAQQYWLAPRRGSVTPLPVDISRDENTIADSGTIHVSLDAKQTRTLLQEVPSAYHTQINDVLLTALTQAFAAWTGQYRLLLDLEGHGREELADELDLSRTVGWFTTQFPVLLDIEQTTDLGEALKAVKEQLREVPQKGLSYGVLRYLSSDQAIVEQLAHLPPAEVAFNYLGQLDSSAYEQSMFGPAHASTGSVHSQSEPRDHLLEINGRIAEGELHVTWRYGRRVHRQETIQRLAQRFIECLEKLIVHCQLLETSVYTPADFPLAMLGQVQLEMLIQQMPLARQRGRDQQIEDIYPLSPMQAGLLFHCLYAPEAAVYCGYFGWTIRGPLDAVAWHRAWRQAVNRHPILRTFFVWQGLTEPLQVVCSQIELPWTTYDWRSLSEQERQQQLDAFRQKEERTGFDLRQAPLLRLCLIRLEEQTYYFHLSLHHLLLDGWSQALLLGEVQTLYTAYCQGKAALLAPGRLYRDYIVWLKQQDTQKAEKFWRAYLAGFTSTTKLAVDRRPYAGRAQSSRVIDVEQRNIPEEITVALQQIGRRSQLTLNTIVQGCWALLLSRYSGEHDVIFGATVAGRPSDLTGVEAMLGLFINTLPVRVHIEQDVPLLSWLTHLQEQQAQVRQYEYTPLVDIQRWSDMAIEQPLFESLLLFQNYPLDPMKKEGVSELAVQGKRSVEYTNYALTLKAAANGKTLTLQLAYDRSRFDAATITRFLDHLQMLLESMAQQPQQRLVDVPLLTGTERRIVLEEWNATQASFPSDMRIDELFGQQALQTPDAVALVYEDRCVTYRFVADAARRVAIHLQAADLEVGAPVGLCVERSLELVIGMLGILYAGGAYVPLDPAFPRERLAFMLEDSQAEALVTQSWLAEIFPDRITAPVYLVNEILASRVDHAVTRKATADQIAYIIYTSGSTGHPKGTMISHRAVGNFFASMCKRPGMDATDYILAVTSFSFDIAALELLQPLTRGACVHIVSQQVTADGIALASLLEASGATLLQATPSTWRMLIAAGWMGNARLKMLCGGEALPADLAVQLRQRGAALWNMYGPTETTIWSAIEDVSGTEKDVSIGCGIDNTQLYVLDSAYHPVPIGGVGELYIAGEGVAYGYWQRPAVSAERFLPNPFVQQRGARMYRTGDRVRWQENRTLMYLGRIDHQVKLRGFRIELGEIEAVLRDHPAVQEAVVVLREESAADTYLAAYIGAQFAPQPAYQELQQHLRKRLPDYMLPAVFVYLEALPLTPNGKINRKALPLPDPAQLRLIDQFVAPETEIQQQLAEFWAELLHLPRVGIHNNFFELGGHSLLATRLAMHIRSAFLVEVPLRSLFEAPTIAELALLIERMQDELIAQGYSEEGLQLQERE